MIIIRVRLLVMYNFGAYIRLPTITYGDAMRRCLARVNNLTRMVVTYNIVLAKREQDLKKRVDVEMKKLLLVGLLLALCVVVSPVLAAPLIWTDKEDYYPWQTVLISGEGFSPSATVYMTVTWPAPDNGIYDVLPPAATNDLGTFNDVEYSLLSNVYGIEGSYTITATDSKTGETVTTTFTDATNIKTETLLDPIDSPLTAGQTGVSFSGSVVPDDTGYPVPINSIVRLQIDTGSGFGDLVSTPTDSTGNFASTFTAPSTGGTYQFRAWFDGASSGTGGSAINWQQTHSDPRSVTVNEAAPTKAKLTVTKEVIIDNGGDADVADFTLYVDAAEVVSGVQNEFDAGTYTISELGGPSGYATTFSGDCDADGSITLAAGEEYACTITNDDIQPILNVIKHVDNKEQGTKDAEDFGLSFIAGGNPSPSSFVGLESPGQEVLLDAGDYEVTEAILTHYPTPAYSDDCKGSIAIGEEKTCTVTNTFVNDPPEVSADNDPVTVNEGDTATNTGAWSDPEDDEVMLDASVGTVIKDSDGTWIWSFTTSDGPADSQTVTITATDEYGAETSAKFELNVDNVAPTIESITILPNVVQKGASISASASFTDPGVLDTHTAVWDWGDLSSNSGSVTESNGDGSVLGTHAYADAGIYIVTLTVTDKDGDADTATYEYVVVYDPSGGFVTGGGWINSPAGASTLHPDAVGKANFGFVSKYKKGATIPEGETEFQFKAGNLNFHSSSYEWLVVAGTKAIYKGEGTVDGAGNYGFMLSAIDGNKVPDKFRIKIWDKNSGDSIVYDNQIGDSETADPSTEIAGGSIVVHK
jgi:hypothetical protein